MLWWEHQLDAPQSQCEWNLQGIKVIKFIELMWNITLCDTLPTQRLIFITLKRLTNIKNKTWTRSTGQGTGEVISDLPSDLGFQICLEPSNVSLAELSQQWDTILNF